jgi:hypothetical protein
MEDEDGILPPGLNGEGADRVALTGATAFNENGHTVCHPASRHGLEARDARIFSCFVVAGLVPPMFLFFHDVLAAYGLHLAHLHPNAVVMLAIFQHLYEAFVGVYPSVALFRKRPAC